MDILPIVFLGDSFESVGEVSNALTEDKLPITQSELRCKGNIKAIVASFRKVVNILFEIQSRIELR